MSEYRKRVEDAIHARLDAIRETRILKERIKLLDESATDILEDWKNNNLSEWIDWIYSIGEGKTAEDAYLEWEKRNPGWKCVGSSIRKVKGGRNE